MDECEECMGKNIVGNGMTYFKELS